MATKIQDMVEQEAARAEAESPDDEGEGDGDGDAGGEGDAEDEAAAAEDEAAEAEEAPPAMGQPPLAAVEGFYKEGERHGKALVQLAEKHGMFFTPCVHCEGIGAVLGQADPLGHLVQADDEVECPDCNGYGYLRRPSRVEDDTIRRKGCPRCASQGVIAKVAPTPSYTPPPMIPAYNAANYPSQPQVGYYDPALNTWIAGTPPPNAYPVS